MKEFEKWNTEHLADSRYRDAPPKQFTTYVEEEREKAWRAALTFAIERSKYAKTFGHLQSELVNELGDK